MLAVELFNAGRLAEAIAEANSYVKTHPHEIDGRSFLCELLCFAGDFERADKLLNTLSSLSDETSIHGIVQFRQLIRAAVSRRDVFESGGVPSFLSAPGPELEERLRAVVCLREGSPGDAAKALAKAEEHHVAVSGETDAGPFSELRDLDDLTASVLEVLTTTGKYYWVPLAKLRSLEFEPLRFARDQLWRAAKIDIEGGPQEGVVYIPAIYQASQNDTVDEPTRLGRVTHLHRIGEKANKRCFGRRIWIFEREERSLLEIETVRITTKADSAP